MEGVNLIQTVSEITGLRETATSAKKFALENFGQLAAHIRYKQVVDMLAEKRLIQAKRAQDNRHVKAALRKMMENVKTN